jgi:hypothetical protein
VVDSLAVPRFAIFAIPSNLVRCLSSLNPALVITFYWFIATLSHDKNCELHVVRYLFCVGIVFVDIGFSVSTVSLLLRYAVNLDKGFSKCLAVLGL